MPSSWALYFTPPPTVATSLDAKSASPLRCTRPLTTNPPIESVTSVSLLTLVSGDTRSGSLLDVPR
ncbi:MAG: hypothetical protein BWY85_00815 [Firmicutes bacterium ADurb.Bin506]|nr:MAG: hypothetical protein BWY85_00815 [Firmicutes bacterium ADurb.Bin506]